MSEYEHVRRGRGVVPHELQGVRETGLFLEYDLYAGCGFREVGSQRLDDRVLLVVPDDELVSSTLPPPQAASGMSSAAMSSIATVLFISHLQNPLWADAVISTPALVTGRYQSFFFFLDTATAMTITATTATATIIHTVALPPLSVSAGASLGAGVASGVASGSAASPVGCS